MDESTLTVSSADKRARRKREVALYATARALTALGEVDEVLATIVRQAHDLMGADLTYLSVIDGGELQLRAVAGSISPEFRSARVSATTGIGGRVIESRAPFWVPNYLTADRIEHSAAFDQIVATEGLVSLLGVPLVANDRALGVLYCALRRERDYSAEEVALLSAFADHASIALENARLYDESRTALADLQQAYATIERSGQVHEALTRVILTGGDHADIAALLTDALGGRVTILDRGGEVVATRILPTAATASDTSSPDAAAWRAAVEESGSTGRPAVRRSTDRWHTAVAISAGDSRLGALVWSHADEPTAYDLRTAERASQIVGLLTLKQEAMVHAEERLRGSVLSELLRTPLPLAPELVERARTMRIDLAAFDAIVVVRADIGPAELSHRLRDSAREWHGLVGEHMGTTVLALAGDDLLLSTQVIHRALRARAVTGALVVGAPVDPERGDFGHAFTLARRCAEVLALAGVTDTATTTTDNGVYGVLFDPDRSAELHRFLENTLGPLQRYDEQYGTALVQTLRVYYECSGNVARTARALFVHNNTLIKRLGRVENLLGADWDRPEKALELHLALRLDGLRQALSR